jgi:hypothetical protein
MGFIAVKRQAFSELHVAITQKTAPLIIVKARTSDPESSDITVFAG